MRDKNIIAYEYQEFPVKRSLASMCADSLENFGWELEGNSIMLGKPDTLILKGKRDRKIRNKAELTRLQRQFASYLSDIQSLEFSKYVKGSAVAYALGIAGTAFMAGSVFAVTSGMVPLCVVLAIPGFLGWALPYFLYCAIIRRKTAEVAPLIDQKHDEIYEVCEKANTLLGG